MNNRFNNMPRRVRLMICGGLLLATLPNLFAGYIKMPDFVRGFTIGLGITLEVGGLILMKRTGVSRCEDSEVVSE